MKTSSLGDVIHNLPVASDLAKRWPGIAIDWVVEESFAEVPRMHPAVRNVIPVAIRRWRKSWLDANTRGEVNAFLGALRAHYYDVVLDTQGLIKSAVITRLAGGLRCGYSREVAREPLAALAYDCRYTIPTTAHAVERNRWLAAAACNYELTHPLSYGLRTSAPAPQWLPAHPYAVLLTATSRADKLWPEDHWMTLAQELGRSGIRVVLPSGTQQERARAEKIAQSVDGAVVAPASSLSELAAVIRDAQCVVGVDTGLTHLAAAMHRPVVALFVATNPGLTGVFGDARAVNLGGIGQTPSVDHVLCTLAKVRS